MMKKIIFLLFIVIGLWITSKSFAWEYLILNAYVDCVNWNDQYAEIQTVDSSSQLSTKPFKTLQYALKKVWELSSSHTNSIYYLKVKDYCYFEPSEPLWNGLAYEPYNKAPLIFNMLWRNQGRNNKFYIEPVSENATFTIESKNWYRSLDIYPSQNDYIRFKNIIFKGWNNWHIISREVRNRLVFTSCKFEVSNQIMWNPSWDPSNWAFTVENSLIEVRKKYWRSILSFPSNFTNNKVNYYSLQDSAWNSIDTDWLFRWHERWVYWNDPSNSSVKKITRIQGNEINVYFPLTRNNFNSKPWFNTNWIVWVWEWDWNEYYIQNNKFTFQPNSFFMVLMDWYWYDYHYIFRNNTFENLEEVGTMTYWYWVFIWINNDFWNMRLLFTNNFDLSRNYNVQLPWNSGCSWNECYICRYCYSWYAQYIINSKNKVYSKNLSNWEQYEYVLNEHFRNWASDWKGVRVAIDLNKDWFISENSILKEANWDWKSSTSPWKSCKDLKARFPNYITGDYWIRPPLAKQSIPAFCDMDSDGWWYTTVWISWWKSTWKYTDDDSCKDLWLQIFTPRSYAHINKVINWRPNWTLYLYLRNSIVWIYSTEIWNNRWVWPWYPSWNATTTAMNSSTAFSNWRAINWNTWFLRSTAYWEPNWNNNTIWAYLLIINNNTPFDANWLLFDDAWYSPKTQYLCSSPDDPNWPWFAPWTTWNSLSDYWRDEILTDSNCLSESSCQDPNATIYYFY